MNRVLILGVVVAMNSYTNPVIAGGHTTDSTATVKSAVEKGDAVLVDVREVDEWSAGHIDAAVHLPLSKLKAGVSSDELKKLLPPGKVVYLHCAAGGRCLVAAEKLKSAGYETRPLKPGYEALVAAGLPVASTTNK